MPYRITQYQDTPNPNALKCVLDGRVAEGSRPFRSAAAAVGDPRAASIFAVPGVVGLLLHENWLTVSKAPDVKWSAIKPALEKALAALPS